MADIVELNEYISYLPASKEPLSADIVFIKAKDCTWVYDVGASQEAAVEVERVCRKKKVVLSHFHPDHVWNLIRTSASEIYVTENTRKYVKKGTVVEKQMFFEGDGKVPDIKLFEIPSSHAKGCLGLLCGDYAFLGDATYAHERAGNHFYNAQILKQMIDLLSDLGCQYVCLSHSRSFVHNREDLINMLNEIYAMRQGNKPEISVESFWD